MVDFVSKFDSERLGIATHAKRSPNRPALIMNDVTLTYRELDQRTNALANGLLKLGLSPGDRLAIMMHNSPEIMTSWSAAGKIAATPIALNYRFKEDELAYIINDSESKFLIYSHEFQEVVEAAKPKLSGPPLTYIPCAGSSAKGIMDFYGLITRNPITPPEIEAGAFGVAPSLIYTSGTTGRPKGVLRNNRNRLNSLMGYAYTFEAHYDDIHLVAGPLYHAAPLAWAAFSILLGNTVVIMPRFEAQNFLALIEKHKVNTTWVVPTMLNRILNLPEEIRRKYDHSSLRVMTVGGESFPFPLKKRVVEYLGEEKVFEFYGGTEISCVTYLRPEDQLRKPWSCGKPAMGSEIKLLGADRQEVPVGEVGVMYVKSDFLLDEYYRNPQATQENYHNGYFTVGDMARMDEEGYYYIVDRAVEMIISGGVNIYPAEIEEALHSLPEVIDAAVIGVPDPDWGEKIVAYLTLKEKTAITDEGIKGHIGQKMASYKKPKEVYFVKELPYSPSGKLLKRVLKEEYARQHK
jgi:fatty-acyl-CoA synthase/long-chain acyl-CoA synthetase